MFNPMVIFRTFKPVLDRASQWVPGFAFARLASLSKSLVSGYLSS